MVKKSLITISIVATSLLLFAGVASADIGIKDFFLYNYAKKLLYSNPVISQVLFGATSTSTNATVDIVGSIGLNGSKITAWPSGGPGGTTTAETTEYIRDGYSARFSESVLVSNVADALDQIFNFIYVAPAVTLAASPTGTTKEYGDPINSILFTATTVKKSNPITAVEFYRGSTLRNTVASPNPNGGAETFTETLQVSSTLTYYAKVGDGTSTTTSSGITYTFVYPFYYGVGAQGLTCAQVQALTKSVKTKSNTTVVTSPVSQVYYFAYPASYGNLTSILDTNLFETISDYTKRTVSCTMLDSTTQTYYIYEFGNLTTQTNFSNQYKF